MFIDRLLFLVLAWLALLTPSESFQRKFSTLSKRSLQIRSSIDEIYIPKRKLVIWDCDGVLVDSEALLKQGEVEALADAGFNLSVDDCVRLFSGVSIDKATDNFNKEYNQHLPLDFFKNQVANSLELFRQRLQPLMKNTVIQLHDMEVQMCVASGSPKNRVDLCLDVVGICPCFPPNTVYTRELVANGKPAPDLFLYAAKAMGYEPKDCIVIEDAVSGILAAVSLL